MRRKAEEGGAVIAVAQWTGRLACVAGFVAWTFWIGWRATSSTFGLTSAAALVLETAALLVAVILSAALWSLPERPHSSTNSGNAGKPELLPDLYARLLGLDGLGSVDAHGTDDTGEVALARRGLRLLDPRAPRTEFAATARRQLATTAWALVAVEGIRRMLFVGLLVAVLLTGRFPFELPARSVLASLVAAHVLFAVGHWLLSGGALRPGVRLRWSMASVGAGLGDGASRTGLPIRWTATMATMIVLNLAVALRGVSDRWTHGLSPMARDERVVAMVVSWWLVFVGFAALRTLAQPSLGFYGATRRLEETSTRRLALGTTLAVAALGFVAGLLPSGLPS